MPVRQVVGGSRQAEVQISVKKNLGDAFYMQRSVGQLFPGQCFLGQVLFWKVGGKRAQSVRWILSDFQLC